METDRIELIKGDITKLEIEAIVNAANHMLKGGGGVDGAIHRAGGPLIVEQCMRVAQKMGGSCPPGEAVITQSGNLPAKYVIHAVGPIWQGGSNHESGTLAQAYRNTMLLARDFGITELAFPNISTGAYGFPKDKAAKIALDVVNAELILEESFKRVVFVCFEDDNYKIYRELLGR